MQRLKRPVALVLFDLGSTLLYEKGPWPALYRAADAALWRVLNAAGVPAGARAGYEGAGNLIEYYYARHRGTLDEPTSMVVLRDVLRRQGYEAPDKVVQAALHAMYAVTQANWEVEQDAAETLRILKRRGFLIGAVSNGADVENTYALIEKAELRPYLQHVVSSASFGRRKPDPGIFRAALERFGMTADRAVMIGDDYEADIVGGHAAGMQAIWITRRVLRPVPKPTQGEPEAQVEALSEIPALLETT